MHVLTKRTATMAAAAIAVLGCAGVGYAYWTTGGTGAGTATTGTSANITANQTSTVTGMSPGDSPQALSGDFTNAGTGPVHVSTVTVSIGSVTLAEDAPAGECSASDYSLADADMSVDADVAVGTHVGGWTGATIQFNDTDADQDACQGATVNLAYAVA